MWLLAMMPALSALAYAPGVWGARVSVIGNTAVQTARGTAGQHLAAGHMLRNRFVLIECLGSASVGTQQGEQGERREAHNEGVNPVPGETFPSVGRLATYSNLYRSLTFKGPKHLGTGSFGDTWRAFDNDRKQFVVLKIFFERFFSERRYLKSDNQWQVQEAAEECLQIQQILATPGADTDPGAKHICQCYENHTTDADDVDQPPFLVLENCGESLEHYQQATFSKRWSWRKHVVEGILEAVDFLSRHNVIHHDLKPDNVCVTNAGEALKMSKPRVLFLKHGICDNCCRGRAVGNRAPKYACEWKRFAGEADRLRGNAGVAPEARPLRFYGRLRGARIPGVLLRRRCAQLGLRFLLHRQNLAGAALRQGQGRHLRPNGTLHRVARRIRRRRRRRGGCKADEEQRLAAGFAGRGAAAATGPGPVVP